MDDRLAQEILDSIVLTGTASIKVNHIIDKDSSHILDLGSGAARISRTALKHFQLIISQPDLINHLSPFEIRCTLCHKVISYPAWYYEVKYDINHFHYFVCFDSSSPNKPSVKCYRRM